MVINDFEIFEVEVNPKGNWLFLKIIGENNCYGLGEFSQSGDDFLAKRIIENKLFPRLKGKNPCKDSLSLVRNITYRDLGQRVKSFCEITAISAIEQALMDFRFRKLGINLSYLKGGSYKNKIPLYANINRALSNRSPKSFADMAEKAVNDNFKAIKCAPFDGVTPYLNKQDWNELVEMGISRIEAIRERIGNKTELMVDCHGRFTVDNIIELTPELEKFALYWLECPVWSTEDLSSLRSLRQKVDFRLAGAERVTNLKILRTIINERLLDVVMPDVKHCGGVHEMLKTITLSEEANIQFSPHNPSGPISTAFSAHLCSWATNNLYLEYPYGEVKWRGDLIKPYEPIENGFYKLNQNEGIGFNLNNQILNKHLIK